MKKTAIVALITASALLMAGAGGSAAADGKAGRVHTVSNATHAIHKPIPGGRTPGSPALRGVKYETLDISQAPAEIQEWASRLVEAGGKGAKTAGEKTYILYALGERPTGGYGVDIRSIVERGDKLVVTVKETAPDPDSMVLQMITYPYVLAAVEKTDLPVRFVAVEKAPRKPDRGESKRVIPRVACKVKNIDR